MIGKEAVSARLHSDSGINFTEFSYQILQAMDFLELYRRHGCVLQTGGSDQWGNLTAGLDLIHHVEGRSVHAFATPLVTKADGTKFGKTESGTVWLDPTLTSPYAFYQFWVNADDRDVEQYLKIFSFRSRAEIEELLAEGRQAPAARAPQRTLAEELTTLVHGADQCQRVIAASRALFGHGSLEALDAATLQSSLAEVPSARVGGDSGLPSVVDLFALTGLSPSRSAARRTVAEGGAYVNNLRMDDPEHAPASETLLHGRWLVLRRGKRNVAVVDVAGG
jgi:tyrosyl-tRNA synthetase